MAFGVDFTLLPFDNDSCCFLLTFFVFFCAFAALFVSLLEYIPRPTDFKPLQKMERVNTGINRLIKNRLTRSRLVFIAIIRLAISTPKLTTLATCGWRSIHVYHLLSEHSIKLDFLITRKSVSNTYFNTCVLRENKEEKLRLMWLYILLMLLISDNRFGKYNIFILHRLVS